MKRFSPSQQHLLNILQITPLQLSTAFASDQPCGSESDFNSPDDIPQLQAIDLTSELAQDITLALPEGVRWSIDLNIGTFQISDKQLVTPALTQLQHAKSKKALWQLLSTIDED